MNKNQEQKLGELKQEIKAMKQMIKELQDELNTIETQCELELDNILSQIEEALRDE